MHDASWWRLPDETRPLTGADTRAEDMQQLLYRVRQVWKTHRPGYYPYLWTVDGLSMRLSDTVCAPYWTMRTPKDAARITAWIAAHVRAVETPPAPTLCAQLLYDAIQQSDAYRWTLRAVSLTHNVVFEDTAAAAFLFYPPGTNRAAAAFTVHAPGGPQTDHPQAAHAAPLTLHTPVNNSAPLAAFAAELAIWGVEDSVERLTRWTRVLLRDVGPCAVPPIGLPYLNTDEQAEVALALLEAEPKP